MSIENKKLKRCGIFLFFDKDGIVDTYVTELLKDLKKNLEYLLVVCNGYVASEGRKALSLESDDVIYRANVGLDVGGYREGIFYIGFKELEQYDELILLNYTFFGPLYPFSEMFDVMDQRAVDFWGITTHHALSKEENPVPGIPYGYMPEHLQSHFFALRKNLFLSYAYKDFMFNMKNPRSYDESVGGYEIIFTKHFEDLGFRWEAYCCSDAYKDSVNHPIMFKALEMVRDLRCPIIKRRAFFTGYTDALVNTCGETTQDAYAYIKNCTDYNVSNIWDNILRLENLNAVHQQMHLNYVLNENTAAPKIIPKVKIFILTDKAYDTYKNLLDLKVDVLNKKIETTFLKTENFSSYAEILSFMTQSVSDTEEYLGILDLTCAAVASMSKKETLMLKQAGIDNLFCEINLIENLLYEMESDETLGVMLSPNPISSPLIKHTSDKWLGNYEEIKAWCVQNQINVNINQAVDPLVTYGGSFWIRAKALKKSEKWINALNGKDKVFMLMILPLLLQFDLWYTGVAYSESYAQSEITNQDYMLRENNKILFEKYGAGSFHEVLNQIR